jgi:hypothetical protein
MAKKNPETSKPAMKTYSSPKIPNKPPKPPVNPPKK